MLQIEKIPSEAVVVGTTSPHPGPADQAFMVQLLQTIDDYLDNPEFNVGLLATKMAMSAPGAVQKVKALTDMTVNDFLKSIRLKKAADLLQQGNLNVSEVAYAVGFNRRKYFRSLRRCMAKHHQIT